MFRFLTSGGIYQIRNLVDGNLYVGSAVNFGRRKTLHWRQLKRGDHHSRYLQRAWTKHGADNFVFEILFVSGQESLLFYEQCIIDHLSPAYNVAPIAGSALGVKRSPETCAKMSAAIAAYHARKPRPPAKRAYRKKRKIPVMRFSQRHKKHRRELGRKYLASRSASIP